MFSFSPSGSRYQRLNHAHRFPHFSIRPAKVREIVPHSRLRPNLSLPRRVVPLVPPLGFLLNFDTSVPRRDIPVFSYFFFVGVTSVNSFS
jgi:hypothetical protein